MVRNTLSLTGCNPVAAFVMRLLVGYLKATTRRNVSTHGHSEVEVWDIVNAGPRHRYQVGVGDSRFIASNCTLGLQYGMGKDKLAVKLTIDTGRRVSVEEAERLIALHKRVYPTYWAWLDRLSDYYQAKKCLKLWDGWALLGDNDNFLSVRNFPTQGTGSVIMREAIRLAHARGLDIISPLHDAIYGLCRVEDVDAHADALGQCMDEAVRAVIGDKLTIRQDRAVHENGHVWIEEKGEKYFKMLSKYLEPMDTEQDLEKRLRETIFSA